MVNRKRMIHWGKRGLSLWHCGQPVPIGRVLWLRKWGRGEDPLIPEPSALKTTGKSLRNPFLAHHLENTELGTWSLTASALDFLERQVQTLQPRALLEFGSGISTVCLARYMFELHGASDRWYVFSVEQDAKVVQKTTQLAESLQLGRYVRVLHAPLCRQAIEGVQTTCYSLPDDLLQAALQDSRPDLVLIDGPAAEPGARFGTLPLVRMFLNAQTRFFLDDALRDGELETVQRWNQLPYVRTNGIYLDGKGLLVGRVGGSTAPGALPASARTRNQ
jgi:hypothetical protein